MIGIGSLAFPHRRPSFAGGARDRDVFPASVGEQGEGGLWEWNGAQLSLLAVGPTYLVHGILADDRLCLVKLGAVQKEDYAFLVLGVFWRYILVMRYLQSTYWLEPAGSHGVWGLDDYQFLPFLWGAGQLKGESHHQPS
jgi:hypothetical protein